MLSTPEISHSAMACNPNGESKNANTITHIQLWSIPPVKCFGVVALPHLADTVFQHFLEGNGLMYRLRLTLFTGTGGYFVFVFLHIASETIALRAIADKSMGWIRAAAAALEWIVWPFGRWYFALIAVLCLNFAIYSQSLADIFFLL